MARRRALQPPSFIPDPQADLRLARQDTVSAMMVWVLLEGLSLMIVPNSQMIQGEQKMTLWLSVSVPLGAVGAILIGVSSWWVKYVQEKVDRRNPNKPLFGTLSQGIGWLGLVGVGFPMIMVGLELWLLMFRGA